MGTFHNAPIVMMPFIYYYEQLSSSYPNKLTLLAALWVLSEIGL